MPKGARRGAASRGSGALALLLAIPHSQPSGFALPSRTGTTAQPPCPSGRVDCHLRLGPRTKGGRGRLRPAFVAAGATVEAAPADTSAPPDVRGRSEFGGLRPSWKPGRRKPAEPPAEGSGAAPSQAPRPRLSKARSIGLIVEKLYEEFNRCDANRTAECFVEDVVYEDLLLGSSTIVESREEFRDLIQSHPVFLGARACESVGLPPPDVRVIVDGISEDLNRNNVGVEWHVEVNGDSLGLGRGISFFRICPETGLIRRAVDIAEAPWRVIGILVAPLAQGFRVMQRILNGLLLPPVLTLAGGLIVVNILLFIFLDKPTLDGLRADIDMLDDYRETLEEAKPASYAELVGRLSEFPGDNPWDRRWSQ